MFDFEIKCNNDFFIAFESYIISIICYIFYSNKTVNKLKTVKKTVKFLVVLKYEK